MKNKKTLFILIPLNLFVWGYIGFVFYSSLNKKEQLVIRDNFPVQTGLALAETDTFSLALNYNDPFKDIFGGSNSLRYTGNISVNKTANPVKKNVKSNAVVVNWPSIKYGGVIKNPKAKKVLALVAINNKEYMLKPGEVKDSVKLIAVFRDSITVQYLKEKRIIKK